MDTIRFYRVDDEWGEFSNFSPHPILIDGERWPTSEHFFQAQKFEDAALRKKIRLAHTPMQAALLGRDRKQRLRRDWESAKVEVMTRAVYAKFSQHVSLRALLLSTAEARLVEHTSNDSYWGDGGDGRGRNMLGEVLMRVRARLRAESSAG